MPESGAPTNEVNMRVALLVACIIGSACKTEGCPTTIIAECPECPEDCEAGDTDAGCIPCSGGIVLSGMPSDGLCWAQVCTSRIGEVSACQDVHMWRQGGLLTTACTAPAHDHVEVACFAKQCLQP